MLHYVICAHDNARLLQLLSLAGHKIYSQASLTNKHNNKMNVNQYVNVNVANYTLDNHDNNNEKNNIRSVDHVYMSKLNRSDSQDSVHFIDANAAAMHTKKIPYSLYNIIKTDMAIAQKWKDLMYQLHPQSKSSAITNSTNTGASIENDAKVFSRSNSMSRENRKASASKNRLAS